MFHHIASCPFCEQGAIHLYCDRGIVLFASGQPCPHLAAVNVCLDALCQGEDGGRSYLLPPVGNWLWVRDLVPLQKCVPGGPHDDLMFYLDHLFLSGLPRPRLRPSGPYVAVGASAGERENRDRGSGYFRLRLRDGQVLDAVLDGWAFYASHPERFVAALPDCVRRWQEVGCDDEYDPDS